METKNFEIFKKMMLDDRGPRCLAVLANGDAALFVKTDRKTIEGFRGRCPVEFWVELGLYPTGAVFRIRTNIFDVPLRPYALEAFLNLADPEDYRTADRMREQKMFEIHCHEDTNLDYVFTKRIPLFLHNAQIDRLIQEAVKYNQQCGRIDFMAAKERMLRDRPLEEGGVICKRLEAWAEVTSEG